MSNAFIQRLLAISHDNVKNFAYIFDLLLLLKFLSPPTVKVLCSEPPQVLNDAFGIQTRAHAVCCNQMQLLMEKYTEPLSYHRTAEEGGKARCGFPITVKLEVTKMI